MDVKHLNIIPRGGSKVEVTAIMDLGESLSGVMMAGATAAMADYLRQLGYTVVAPNGFSQWETPTVYCRRLGISTETLRRRLASPARPPVETHRTDTGRVLELAASPEFEAFCQPKHKLQPFDPGKPAAFVWWSWSESREKWCRSCWHGPTEESAWNAAQQPLAAELWSYHNKLIREDFRGYFEVADCPAGTIQKGRAAK